MSSFRLHKKSDLSQVTARSASHKVKSSQSHDLTFSIENDFARKSAKNIFNLQNKILMITNGNSKMVPIKFNIIIVVIK